MRIKKASCMKIARTHESVLAALRDLLEEGRPASGIRKSHICTRAGVSTDVLYSRHHEQLRIEVERRLKDARDAQADKPSARRKMIPASYTASMKIAELQDALERTKLERDAALHAANMLSQTVSALLKEAGENRSVLPFQTPSGQRAT